MKQIKISRLLLPALLGVAAVALASIHTDYDHHADFSQYHTYSWIGVRAGNSLWQDRIMAAVDSQLAARGLTKVESGGDLAVSGFGKVNERDNLQTFYDGFPGWGWRGWGGMGMATTEVVPERIGTLTVDLFDGKTKHLVWRGITTETLSGKPEKNEKKMDEEVGKMFEHFPPHSKG